VEFETKKSAGASRPSFRAAQRSVLRVRTGVHAGGCDYSTCGAGQFYDACFDRCVKNPLNNATDCDDYCLYVIRT
jgi:hypothetical protein